MRLGVNALRSPTYLEMIEIVNGREVDFAEYRFVVLCQGLAQIKMRSSAS